MDLFTSSTGLFDLLLGGFGEVLRTDDERNLWKLATASYLEEAVSNAVDDWDWVAGTFCGSLFTDFLRNKRPELVDVDGRVPLAAWKQVKVPHSDFAEVAGMIAIEPCSLMMHTASISVASWALPVLADTAIAH